MLASALAAVHDILHMTLDFLFFVVVFFLLIFVFIFVFCLKISVVTFKQSQRKAK